MKIMLIDDEKPALDELCYFLKDYPVDEIKTYGNPLLALEEIPIMNPDVIFVDIEMPQMNGIDFAQKVRAFNKDISIVFVTAYSEFALDGYKVHPVDYVLKPINESYFQNTMQHVLGICQNRKMDKDEKNTMRIQCFDKFEVYDKNGEIVKFATKKTKELLVYFLAKSNRKIYRDELLMHLFPDVETDKALNNFYVSLHRLRKAMETAGLFAEDIIITENGITYIKEGLCPYVDLCKFILQSRRMDDSVLLNSEGYLNIYSNDLFSDIDYHWLDEEREWFEVQVESIFIKVSTILSNSGNSKKAEEILQRYVEINSLSVVGHEALLDLYKNSDNQISYKNYYKKYVKLMMEEFKSEVEKEYIDYYKKISNSK